MFFSNCLVNVIFHLQVVKRPGVIIKPIEFKEVNPHEKTEQRNGDKRKFKKNKVNADNPMKKGKVGRKS